MNNLLKVAKDLFLEHNHNLPVFLYIACKGAKQSGG
jgi:hypothetical protein